MPTMKWKLWQARAAPARPPWTAADRATTAAARPDDPTPAGALVNVTPTVRGAADPSSGPLRSGWEGDAAGGASPLVAAADAGRSAADPPPDGADEPIDDDLIDWKVAEPELLRAKVQFALADAGRLARRAADATAAIRMNEEIAAEQRRELASTIAECEELDRRLAALAGDERARATELAANERRAKVLREQERQIAREREIAEQRVRESAMTLAQLAADRRELAERAAELRRSVEVTSDVAHRAEERAAAHRAYRDLAWSEQTAAERRAERLLRAAQTDPAQSTSRI